MSSLTFKQARVRDFIANFIKEHGYSPTYQEIADALKLRSLATVSKHVMTLLHKDAIKVQAGRSRSIEVLAVPGVRVSCPHCHTDFRIVHLLPAKLRSR